MRKRLFAAALVAAGVLGSGAGVVASGGSTVSATPGPNDHNLWGLCKAYFAGSPNGRAHKHKAPPFANLEQAAGGADKVADYCKMAAPGDSDGNAS